MNTVNNPFKPGNGILPPYFAGRQEELDWFKKSLKTALELPQNLVISGIRGTGKTALLQELEQICEKNQWLCVRREFNENLCGIQEFAIALVTDFAVKLKGLGFTNPKSKIGFLAESKDEVLDDDYIFSLLSKYPGLIGDKLKALLFEMFPIIKKSGYKGMVLLYDEFHAIQDGKIDKSYPLSLLLEAFGQAQQKDLKYYLVLSGLPPLFTNLVDAKTYAERMFRVFKLENLLKEDAKKAIMKPLTMISIKFEKALVDEIINISQGYPYLIQFFCHFILQNIPKKRLGLSDFKRILSFAIKQLDGSFYAGRFNRATGAEQDALFAMAKSGVVFTPLEIRKHIRISKGDLNKRIYGLIEKNLIYKIGYGKYAFAMPAFNEFLQREELR